MKQDPRLAMAAEEHWHFLKFRFVRRIHKKDDLDRQSWSDYIDSDPPLWDPPTQLQII